MFGRNFHEVGSHTVTVHEHRAPTDQSVSILKELEAEARAKVMQSVRLENSPIDCVIHKCDDMMNDQTMFSVFVHINGKRLEIRKSIQNSEASCEHAAESLIKAVSERIATEILGKPFNAAVGKFWR